MRLSAVVSRGLLSVQVPSLMLLTLMRPLLCPAPPRPADAKQCVEKAWFRPVMAVLPAWLRFAQCLRRYRDTREAYPHLANAFKYSTVFVVIIFTSLATQYAGGWVFTGCSPGVHQVFAGRSPGVHEMFTRCSPGVHEVLTSCSPGVQLMFTSFTDRLEAFVCRKARRRAMQKLIQLLL